MVKRMAKAVLAVALVAGCGEPGLMNQDGQEMEPIHDDPVATTGQEITAELRMRGIGAEDFTSLLLVASNIQVLADGQPAVVELASDLVDLARMDHAERIATLRVPAEAQEVEIAIELGAAGGFIGLLGDDWVDTRQTVLRFTSTVENLATGKTVVVLDADRSLVSLDGASLTMVPKFRVWH